MSDWIFTGKDYKSGTEEYSANHIYRRRMQDGFWGLGEKTRNRTSVQKGDRVVFYLASPLCSYVGTAVLASDCAQPSDEEQRKLRHNGAFHAVYGVWLESIDEFREPRSMRDLAYDLDFVKNKTIKWGNYLQGGIRSVGGRDFDFISSSRASV